MIDVWNFFGQPTGSNHSNFGSIGQADALPCRPEPSRGRGDTLIQVLDDGCRLGRVGGWIVKGGVEPRDEQDREGNSTAAAYRVEYELPEPDEGVCEPTRILEPCSRADVVRDGEARDTEVLESGEYPTLLLNDLVLIVLVSMGSIEEGGPQVWGPGYIIIEPQNCANRSSQSRVGV